MRIKRRIIKLNRQTTQGKNLKCAHGTNGRRKQWSGVIEKGRHKTDKGRKY